MPDSAKRKDGGHKPVMLPTSGVGRLKGDVSNGPITPLTRVLALAFRIQQCGIYTLADAKREFGVSHRTFYRDIARLKYAGAIIESPRTGGDSVRWVGYDLMMSEDGKVA